MPSKSRLKILLKIKTNILNLIAIHQIASVAKTWHDVLVFVEDWVDGTADEDDVVGREDFLQVVHSALGGDDASHDQSLWGALGLQGIVGKLKAASCGEHRVNENEGLVVEARRGTILDLDANLVHLTILVVTEG